MRNIILSVIAAMSAMLAVSCQKGDGEADYGNSLIYIPQATVSAGIDNYYNVPSGGAENTLNFGTTETDVDIYLGVMLSGKKAGSGFSVNIVEDSEASISAAAALGATVLPSSAYELPSVVNVASGRNSGTFSLVLRKEFVMETTEHACWLSDLPTRLPTNCPPRRRLWSLSLMLTPSRNTCEYETLFIDNHLAGAYGHSGGRSDHLGGRSGISSEIFKNGIHCLLEREMGESVPSGAGGP